MHLNALELARLEAMMERGQVFSEPASPCATDRMLDELLARARSAPPREAAPARRPRQAASWLDLPSLPELLDARRTLLATGTREP